MKLAKKPNPPWPSSRISSEMLYPPPDKYMSAHPSEPPPVGIIGVRVRRAGLVHPHRDRGGLRGELVDISAELLERLPVRRGNGAEMPAHLTLADVGDHRV